MIEKYLNNYFKFLAECALPAGGFSYYKGGRYRADATAWAALALGAFRVYGNLVASARERLCEGQLEDGRVLVSPECPDTFWPTSLAVLAWRGSPKHYSHQMRAVEFLLGNTGLHYVRRKDSPVAHDTAIRGWPWILKTHSWVEPTSMALLALELVGKGRHQRAQEGRQMLLDRQLESGGWNYGNTKVFGQQLRSMPESTGVALNALSGRVNRGLVEKSISYLKSEFDRLCTPLSMCWSAMGLSAWGERPANLEKSVLHCLDLQKDYGSYSTEEISLMLVSIKASAGLLSVISDQQ